ncbi:MFS transporter [Actinophytocola oryzae]|uniref:Putative MFS family arabinose efflux permease n=1 Tax=Actinophytocola oryzae TaxID=502181 RepID=A0A4R7VNG1_9PSEU|nr:MFS transporter [Actinophytocola oryzae]TDV51072.1 putative MFS family arabinose efflux permease [Actinophytocola oryzae]
MSTSRLPREVWVLVVANFIIAVGFGLVAPALPTFARAFNVSVTAASVVVSAFAVARLLFAPASGRLVTLLGERRVYLAGITIVAVSTGACAFAGNYWQLLLFRGAGGIGSTMFTVSAIALLIRLTPAPLRGRASGLWGTGFLAGNVTGPLLGGGLLTISLRAPFLVYAALLLVVVVFVWWFLRHSTLAASVTESASDFTLRSALRHRSYVAALGSSFANGWAVFGVRVSLVPLFVEEVLRRDGAFAGTALAVFAAGNVAMLMVSGRLADSWGRRPLVLAGLLVSGGGTVWVGFTDSVPWFLTATVVAGLGAGCLSPPLQATVADVIGSRGRGGPALATFQMAADLGAVLGPIAAGLLADNWSYSAAFAVTGSLCVVAALGWLTAPETLPRDEPAEDRQHPLPNEALGAELPGCDDRVADDDRRATDPA